MTTIPTRTVRVIFHGEERDKFGMPIPWHVFWIMTHLNNSGGGYLSRIFQVTDPTVLPEELERELSLASPDDAERKSLTKLEQRFAGKGLKSLVHPV